MANDQRLTIAKINDEGLRSLIGPIRSAGFVWFPAWAALLGSAQRMQMQSFEAMNGFSVA